MKKVMFRHQAEVPRMRKHVERLANDLYRMLTSRRYNGPAGNKMRAKDKEMASLMARLLSSDADLRMTAHRGGCQSLWLACSRC